VVYAPTSSKLVYYVLGRLEKVMKKLEAVLQTDSGTRKVYVGLLNLWMNCASRLRDEERGSWSLQPSGNTDPRRANLAELRGGP
jgi:hypothetical protein